jgi:hypothetical protein
MGLFNMRPLGFKDRVLKAEYVSESISEGDRTPILQWVPTEGKVPVSVMLPDATQRTGLAEEGLKGEPAGSVVQLVRFGFCRIDNEKPDRVVLYFAHE